MTPPEGSFLFIKWRATLLLPPRGDHHYPKKIRQDFALAMTVGILGATSATSQESGCSLSFVCSVFGVLAP